MVNLSDQKLETFDYEDSKKMFAFGVETVNIASQYQSARKIFALSLKTLKLGLAKAYAATGIRSSISEDKAYLILANDQPEMREALMNKIDNENQYKGLEKVLETRQAVMSLVQSLIKNRIEQT